LGVEDKQQAPTTTKKTLKNVLLVELNSLLLLHQKKNPCKNQSFTKRKENVNACQKNKSKFLATNP
jgi:hypothetical protein